MRALLIHAVLVAAAHLGSAFASDRPSVPPPERIPELARDLGARLAERQVAIPGGGQVTLFSTTSSAAALLTPERLEACLVTVSEAEAWPSTWLVVQDRSRDYDVLLRIRFGEDARVADPDPIFTAPRREWDSAAVEARAREATGKKPARERNLVVQSFSQKTETTYVYEPSRAEGPAQGLLPLLPKGALIRDAKRIDLEDGNLHTLALVLVDAKFIPSTCASCAARALGHVDRGTVLVVLAGEKALEDTLDLSPTYRDSGVEPFLPRYACTVADEEKGAAGESVSARFHGRELLPLLRGGTTFALPLEDDCERKRSLELAVVGDPPKIRVLETR